MKINTEFYKAIRDSGGVPSDVPGLIAQLQDDCSAFLTELGASPLALLDPTRLESAQTAASILVGELIAFQTHVDEQLEHALHNISIGKLAKQIDATVNETEESDSSIKTVIGSISGTGRTLINDCSQSLSSLLNQANAFQATNSHQTGLDQTIDQLSQQAKKLGQQISDEKAALAEMQKSINYLSHCYSLESLSTDAQCHALIQQLMPDNIVQMIPIRPEQQSEQPA